ncbi:MAG: hypothetical protein NC343_00965 [Muribaculum sp.]|nr:hypothetical protein [Muribaculaceae bacterium]MCM1080306.1 hypothetical protein [Muribaculum sp.]
MKYLISIITLLIAAATLSAKPAPSKAKQNTTAKINRVWVEPGTIRDGRPGVTIHADIDLDNALGRIIASQAMFYSSPGGWTLRDKNGQYRVSPSLNYVAAFDFFRSDERTVRGRDDIAIFIPVEELHISGSHKYRIYTQLTFYADLGKDGVCLATSDYYPILIDQTKKGQPKSIADTSAPVTIAQAKELQKANKSKGIVAMDKVKKEKKPKKEKKKKNKKEKTAADSTRTTRNSTVQKEVIDPATFWEKEEIDSLSLPKLYFE